MTQELCSRDDGERNEEEVTYIIDGKMNVQKETMRDFTRTVFIYYVREYETVAD